MNDLDLARRLPVLRSTLLMLRTELRHEHMDEALIAEMDQQMGHGIATEPRCTALPAAVAALRENALSMGENRFDDTIGAFEKLNDAVEDVVSRLD